MSYDDDQRKLGGPFPPGVTQAVIDSAAGIGDDEPDKRSWVSLSERDEDYFITRWLEDGGFSWLTELAAMIASGDASSIDTTLHEIESDMRMTLSIHRIRVDKSPAEKQAAQFMAAFDQLLKKFPTVPRDQASGLREMIGKREVQL